jgi:hypothetical protein
LDEFKPRIGTRASYFLKIIILSVYCSILVLVEHGKVASNVHIALFSKSEVNTLVIRCNILFLEAHRQGIEAPLPTRSGLGAFK